MHIRTSLCTSCITLCLICQVWYIYILMTLHMYYPVFDAIMGTRCEKPLWHIWWRYVWYICSIYVICVLHSVCHVPRRPPITPPIGVLELALSSCIFKLIVDNTISSRTQLLLTSAELQQLCSRLSVTPFPTLLPDCLWWLWPAVTNTWSPVRAYLFLL